MARDINSKWFPAWRQWSFFLLLFVLVTVYPRILWATLHAFLGPTDTWSDYDFDIAFSAMDGSLFVPSWILSMWAALGFRRLATPCLWGLLFSSEAYRLAHSWSWSWPYSLDSVASFLFFLLPWLFIRCCLRWRCFINELPSADDIDRRNLHQFNLAELLLAVTAIGILLACHRSELSQQLRLGDLWWILDKIMLYPPGYCLVWVILADRRARHIGLGAFFTMSLGWVGFAFFMGGDSHILFFRFVPYYVSTMAGLALAFLSLRLLGVRLVSTRPGTSWWNRRKRGSGVVFG